MARIRSIKPEFWTDEKIVQLPFSVRLLFIGLWNFADDDGYVLDEPERIKLQVLPADSVDAELLIDLLVATELIERIDLEDGRVALYLPNFERHQKISHKTPTKLPIAKGKKRNIPTPVRRAVAIKYGCQPGKDIEAACYYCGAKGKIWWPTLTSGRPHSWVCFSGLEIDHFVPENTGGEGIEENIVLSCRYCNRSKQSKDAIEFFCKRNNIIPENSGPFRPEGKGREGKGEESIEPASAAKESLEKKVYRRGKEVLGSGAGGFISKLRKHFNGHDPTTLRAIEAAATKQDPREFLGAILKGGHASEFGKRISNDEKFAGPNREQDGIIHNRQTDAELLRDAIL